MLAWKSTIRATLKKVKATGTVTNMVGRGPMFIFPPRTVRRMIREAKKYPRITFGKLQRKVASRGHHVSKTTIRHHLHSNKLFGRHAIKKTFLSSHHKCKHLELSTTGTLSGIMLFGQMKLKFWFLATNTVVLFYWQRLYKVLNAGVPIIVTHVVLFKIIISYWAISFSQITFISIKVGSFSLFQCEIKLI